MRAGFIGYSNDWFGVNVGINWRASVCSLTLATIHKKNNEKAALKAAFIVNY